MKKLFLIAVLFCLSVAGVFAQRRKPAAVAKPSSAPAQKSAAKKPAAQPAPQKATEISAAEWSAIVEALEKEDWTRAGALSSAAIGKLKTDNERKQLARLRYFYLYALAGRAAAGQMTYDELGRAAARFVGQEFLMPSREFLADCRGKVNYICPVKGDETILRVTATNRSGSAIHAFEYVRLNDAFDLGGRQGQAAFLRGRLDRAEISSPR
jgi:hypothetical protein